MAQPSVFISYVRENKDMVDRLATDLRTLGIKIWLDRNDIMPGQWWKDAIGKAIEKGAFFIACYSKELNERQDTYMHGELRLAIDRLISMPRERVWFIRVMLNETEIPSHRISDHETLKDINTIALYKDWDQGLAMILRAMKLEDDDYRRALYLVDAIKYHPEERVYTINHLVDLALKQYSIERRDSIAHLAVPALVATLKDDQDKDVRRLAAEVLGKIGPAAAEAAPALAAALKDPDEVVRRLAVEALGNIGPAAVSALVAALKDDQDKDVRRLAVDALGKIAAHAFEETEEETKLEKEFNFYQRQAREVWKANPAAAGEAVRAFEEAARRIGPRLNIRSSARQAAAEALAEAAPALAAALEDPDDNVRARAAWALKRIS